jgi:hypothetical protein
MITRYSSALAILGLLSGCTPLPDRYVNSVHPEYGAQQFATDVGVCRQRAATQVVSTLAGYYPLQSAVEVDDAKLGACMARSGWQTAPPSLQPAVW